MGERQTEIKSTAKRILVVEDEFISAFDIKANLLKLGYEVPVIVDNGEDAIQKAAELLPDLILMDIVLIGSMSGIEAAAEIQQSHGIPIVYLTALTDADTIGKAKISESFGYLPKPCTAATMMRTIEMALYKSEVDASRKRE